MNRKIFFILTLTAFLSVTGPASVLSAEFQRISGAEDALAGLATLQPRIHHYQDGALLETSPAVLQIQSDVERILSDAGIKLVGKQEFDRLVASRSYPIGRLDVEVRTAKFQETDLMTYVLSVKVRQAVFLARKPVVRFLASSWESIDFGAAKDFSFIRSLARDALGRLAQDLQAQNAR